MKYIATILIAITLAACDFCTDTAGPGEEGEAFLYMTGFPEVGENPGVYKYDIDNKTLSPVAENAMIFSAPSTNGDFLMLRNETSGAEMVLKNSSGQETVLQESNVLFDISSPKIASTGEIGVFYGGDDKLYKFNMQDKSIDRISSSYESNYTFSISPDGKKIAFFERDDNSVYILKVIDSEKTDDVIFSKSYPNISLQAGVNTEIEWSSDENDLIFACEKAGKLQIVACSLSGNEMIYEISSELGGFNPVPSPLGNQIIFVSGYGEIWSIETSASNEYFKITDNENSEVDISTMIWNGSGSNLYYVESFYPESGGVLRNLYEIEVTSSGGSNPKTPRLICNNVFNVFRR
jgi:Tol biopolymer transport system component